MNNTCETTDRSINQLTGELLEDLQNPTLGPLELCQLHNLTLPELAAILESESYQQAVECIARISTARDKLLEPQSKSLAKARLTDLLKTYPETDAQRETQRKAATALLASPQNQRQQSREPRADSGAVGSSALNSPMPPKTRLLIPSDAPQYTALRKEMLEESPHSFGSSPGEARCTSATELEHYLATPSNTIVGSFQDNQLASVVGIMRESKSKQQHRAFIWGVYTPPSHRSKGHARSAMQHAIDTARTWPGVEIINLAVLDLSIPARELYKSLGFTHWGTEPDSIRYQSQPIPSHHLILNITN